MIIEILGEKIDVGTAQFGNTSDIGIRDELNKLAELQKKRPAQLETKMKQVAANIKFYVRQKGGSTEVAPPIVEEPVIEVKKKRRCYKCSRMKFEELMMSVKLEHLNFASGKKTVFICNPKCPKRKS